MSKQIILSSIPLEELILKLKSELQPLINPPQKQNIEEEMLTAKQTAALLGVSLVSLHKWKKAGIINFYRYGSRIRFKKSEIMQVEKYKNIKEK